MPELPAGVKTPQDRKPKAAVVAEGQGTSPDPIAVDYNGTTYVIDPVVMDDLEVLEALEDEKGIKLLRLILADQYDKMKAQLKDEAGGGRVTNAAVEQFLGIVFGALNPTDKR